MNIIEVLVYQNVALLVLALALKQQVEKRIGKPIWDLKVQDWLEYFFTNPNQLFDSVLKFKDLFNGFMQIFFQKQEFLWLY